MPVDFNAASATSITSCVDEDSLRDLTDEQREVVLLLMSRAAERSYRRGFQQGAHIARERPADLPESVHDWRYRRPTDQSPWADCPHIERSVDRLLTENSTLRAMGLYPPDDDLENRVAGRWIARLADEIGHATREENDYDANRLIDWVFVMGHNFAAEGGLMTLVRAYEAAETFGADMDGLKRVADAWEGIAGWTPQPEVDHNVIYPGVWPEPVA